MTGLGVSATGLTKRFGGFTALDGVDMEVRPGSFHALLGENGAGKSTLVKCVMGYYQADAGTVRIAGEAASFANPKAAHKAGLGMVYQHFTSVPGMTVAENLVMAQAEVPARIDWRAAHGKLERFMATMPFRLPLRATVGELAAGERQKLELLKQLYLERRFLILDEPTSVLTPAEADEVLGLVKAMTEAGQISVLIITHKFREVTGFADAVTILRRGRLAGAGAVADLTTGQMAAMMVGGAELPRAHARRGEPGVRPVLVMDKVEAVDRAGKRSLALDRLEVKAGQIVGIAGVSGNGQREMVEVLGGQRRPTAGHVIVQGEVYAAKREEMNARRVRILPEEPLRNACVGGMSVADNLAFRDFDRTASGAATMRLDRRAIRGRARELIARYAIKASSPEAPIHTLSGGNVQRSVLARELSGAADLLIVANPCFGLDFAATATIRSAIVDARNAGTAVLLVSEDLDELLELADRILVMSDGKIAYATDAATADRQEIGRYMAGH